MIATLSVRFRFTLIRERRAPSAAAFLFCSELRRTRRSFSEGGHPQRELTPMLAFGLHVLRLAWPQALPLFDLASARFRVLPGAPEPIAQRPEPSASAH